MRTRVPALLSDQVAVRPARRRRIGLFLGVLLLATFALAGCESENGGSPIDVTPPLADTFTNLAGTWRGTWTDTRYNVSGSLEATMTVVGSAVNASGTIGLQALGLGNETGSGSGTVSGQNLNFNFSASTVGTGAGTLFVTGMGNGTGTVTGVLNLGAFTYSGTAVGRTINGTFTFTSPTGGRGVATLTKQ